MTPYPCSAEQDRFDPRVLRTLFGCFPTGVTIVTCLDRDGRTRGMTANSFVSLSLDPPLVNWNVSKHAPSYDALVSAQVFAFSILAHDQVHISSRFSQAHPDKFEGMDIQLSEGGVPVIVGSVAQIVCRQFTVHDVGDHTIVVGRVIDYRHLPKDPLIFKGGRYFTLERMIEA